MDALRYRNGDGDSYADPDGGYYRGDPDSNPHPHPPASTPDDPDPDEASSDHQDANAEIADPKTAD